jgi:hypothetical protein
MKHRASTACTDAKGEIAEVVHEELVTLQDLFIATLAMTEALSNLLTEKGIIDHKEFTEKLSVERAKYHKLLNRTLQ